MARDKLKNNFSVETGSNRTFAPSSGVSFLGAAWSKYGKITTVTFGIKITVAITTTTPQTIGSLNSDFRPLTESFLSISAPVTNYGACVIRPNGDMILRGQFAANSEVYITGTYVSA